ncbi:uncharacterized protein LOC132747157 [Ruditapes philippinarum]|uniref:uncharacterized protein LOC132747157 n=1 Tax=Ruditapes philippinarum TaxID=129788 RepID=UPI00295A6F59|nr:uncharacterized protein LOC132747157 [Ruditapes philippinarum]
MYDPTCEEHKQFEVESKQVELPQPVERKKKKKGKKEVTALETEPAVILPEVTKEKFYEISDTLKNTFVEKAKATTDAPSSGGGFSLLAAFGTHYSDDDSDDDANVAKGAEGSAIPIPDVLRTNQLSLANRFNVRDDAHHEDSDGDDDEKEIAGKELEKNVEKMYTTEPTSKQALDITKPKNFFFLPNDERLKESVTQKKDSSNQGDWFSKRRHLIESYKSKHKNLRRKKGPMKKRGGKR